MESVLIAAAIINFIKQLAMKLLQTIYIFAIHAAIVLKLINIIWKLKINKGDDMYKTIIYYNDDPIEELGPTYSIEEAEDLGIKYIIQLENKEKYWFKIEGE